MRLCSVCCAPTTDRLCRICRDPSRDHAVICVVEDLPRLLAVESTGAYHGLYHVLYGAINPLDGIGPDQLRFRELLARFQEPGIREVILATKPNTNGDSTAMYISRAISPFGMQISRRR